MVFMNERIRELAEQASIFAFTEYPKQTMATFFTNKSVEQLFNEKFAELIVRECVLVGGTAFLNDNSTVPIFPAKQIQEHFGVE
jgi:hypothetical protein